MAHRDRGSPFGPSGLSHPPGDPAFTEHISGIREIRGLSPNHPVVMQNGIYSIGAWPHLQKEIS
jgi:hypothetical protein